MAFALVPDGNGVFEVLDTDPINGTVAIITLILNVLHWEFLQKLTIGFQLCSDRVLV
jgi:hypothetical protein